jgi:hypothetical protein
MGPGERNVRVLAASAGHRTLKDVARAANVDRHTLIGAARGEKTPTRPCLERIALVLRVSPDLLAKVFADARRKRERARS